VKILLDADSCPRPARELVTRAAKRTGLALVFAANRPIPADDGVIMEVCEAGEGAADDRLAELADEGDIAITRDIPLAQRLLEKGAAVLDDRGRRFTRDNIGEFLSIRNWTVALADSGLDFERSARYGQKELRTFAAGLDKILTSALKSASKTNV
jgi:uncharacterized protein YaiI (UPF0178 family)